MGATIAPPPPPHQPSSLPPVGWGPNRPPKTSSSAPGCGRATRPPSSVGTSWSPHRWRVQGGCTMLDGQARRRSRRARAWVTASPILALLAVFALMAAGCGGSSETKSNEAYANGVCTAIGSWEQQIKDHRLRTSAAASRKPPSRRRSRRPGPRPKRSWRRSGLSHRLTARRAKPPSSNSISSPPTSTTRSTPRTRRSQSSRPIRRPPGSAHVVATLAPQVQSLASETESADQHLEERGRIASLGVQEHRLLQEPWR